MDIHQGTSLCRDKNFNEAYRSSASLLFHYLYYSCGDKEQAKDLVQEAFLELWNNCKKVESSKARAYVFKVARNKMLNLEQKKKVRIDYVNRQPARSEGNLERPDFILEKNEFQKQLETAISDLPVTQREVFLMNRVDGLKYREIAELLEISQKAVEKRMHKALVSLRKVYHRI